MDMIDSQLMRESYTYVPIGYIHDIENIGDTDAKFLVVFNNEKSEDFQEYLVGSAQCKIEF